MLVEYVSSSALPSHSRSVAKGCQVEFSQAPRIGEDVDFDNLPTPALPSITLERRRPIRLWVTALPGRWRPWFSPAFSSYPGPWASRIVAWRVHDCETLT